MNARDGSGRQRHSEKDKLHEKKVQVNGVALILPTITPFFTILNRNKKKIENKYGINYESRKNLLLTLLY